EHRERQGMDGDLAGCLESVFESFLVRPYPEQGRDGECAGCPGACLGEVDGREVGALGEPIEDALEVLMVGLPSGMTVKVLVRHGRLRRGVPIPVSCRATEIVTVTPCRIKTLSHSS